MVIVFDIENRQFSAISDACFADAEKSGKFKNFITNRTTIATGAGAVVGGIGGTAIARAKAKKKAEELGIEPGTPEYKQLMKKATLKGAAIGTAAGAGTGYLGERGVDIGKKYFDQTKGSRSLGKAFKDAGWAHKK